MFSFKGTGNRLPISLKLVQEDGGDFQLPPRSTEFTIPTNAIVGHVEFSIRTYPGDSILDLNHGPNHQSRWFPGRITTKGMRFMSNFEQFGPTEVPDQSVNIWLAKYRNHTPLLPS